MATLNANARQANLLRAGTENHSLTLSHLSVVCYITECIHHQHVQHKKTWLGSRGSGGGGRRGGSGGRRARGGRR